MRETLFNWLGQDLSGLTCLDLYAGSGALGFEAASRGARSVVMVENDRAAHAAIVRNREQLGAAQVEVLRSDALEFVRSDARQYDVIFLDPPFALPVWESLLPAVSRRLVPGGFAYCEAGDPPAWPAGWAVRKQGRAGQVSFQLLQTEPQ